MANIIKGHNLMLFDSDGESIAFATNHTLSLNGDAQNISSKDHGIWGASEVNKLTWEITTENLYTTEAFDDLFSKMVARTSITVYFALKAEDDDEKSVVDGDYTEWSKATSGYTGKVVITSLSANAPDGANATFSCTLTGAGKIEHYAPTPTPGT